MTLEQFLRILGARQLLIWAVCVLVTALVLGINLLLPKRYTATATVLVDVRTPDPVQGQGPANVSALSPSYMATQVDIVSSERVAQQVVRLIGLDKNPKAIERWQSDGRGLGTIEQYYGETLKNYLDVKPSRESNIVTIDFTNVDPRFAATVANAFARSYVDTTASLRADPARDYANWFDDRTKQLRERLEQAQARLSTFQQENGIVATDDRLDVETTRLNELNTQLTHAQGLRAESSSRDRQASSEMTTSPDVVRSPVIEALSADVARTEAKLDQLGQQLGHKHPQYIQQKAELDSLKLKLSSEMKRIASSVGVSYAVDVQREAEIQKAADAQKRRVLELKRQRDEMAVLQREVEFAQHAYDQVAQRFSQTSLESQSHLTNIVLLSPAQPPTRASRPRVMINTAFGFLAGITLGVCAALIAELRRRRLRGADDVAQTIGLPVLASLPDAQRKRKARLRTKAISQGYPA